MAKKKWTKHSQKLRPDHRWKSKPGYQIFVANRGEVRFDFPVGWVMAPGEDAHITIRDREAPDDDCLLQLSIWHLPEGVDWTGLPIARLLEEATNDDSRGSITRGEVHYEKRADLELAWFEGRWIDPSENRDAISRACLARGGDILPFITMDLWVDDLGRFGPVWDEVLRSLRLGDYVKDPRVGEVYRMDQRHN